MFAGFERKKIEAGGGITINCAVGGTQNTKGPPVLLLHGYPQNMTMWAQVAPLIAEKYTVICTDLRGYGDSSKPRGLPDYSNYTFRAMAGDQVAVMKALGFDRFHVAGHDRGARVTHRMTLDHPMPCGAWRCWISRRPTPPTQRPTAKSPAVIGCGTSCAVPSRCRKR